MIIAVVVDKIFPKQLTQPTASEAGDVLAIPETNVTVKGWGFGQGSNVTLEVAGYSFTITSVLANDDGYFEVYFQVKSQLLDPLSVSKGIFTIKVHDNGVDEYKEFTLAVEEVPVIKVKVASDPNVFPAQIGSIAIRAYLQYSNKQVPLDLTGGQPVMQFKELEVYIYYYDGTNAHVEKYTITASDVAGATYDSASGLYEFTVAGSIPAYYNNETGMLILYYTFDNVGGSAVIDVVVTANYAGTGQNVTAYDHSVTSIEGYLEGVLESINTTVLNVNGTLAALINTAKGEILANITALSELVQSGFDNVTLLVKDNATTILNAIAALETALNGNASEIEGMIANLTSLLEEASSNLSGQITELNATVVAQIAAALEELEGYLGANTTAIITAINNAYNELEGKVESLNATMLAQFAALELYLDNKTAYLEGVIDSEGNLVISTVIGQLQIAKDEVEALISNSTSVILQAVAGTGAQVIATLEGDINAATDIILTVLGSQINASTEALMAAVENAQSQIQLAIDMAKAELEVYVNSTVYNASEYVLAEVYAYLFGPSGASLHIKEANVSIAQLISQAKQAVVQTVQQTGNNVKAELEAYIGSVKVDVIGAINASTDAVNANIDQAKQAIVSEVDSQAGALAGLVNATSNETAQKIDEAVTTLSQKIADVSSKVDQLSNNLNTVSSDLAGKLDNVQKTLSDEVSAAKDTSKSAANYALAATVLSAIAMILAGIGVYFARAGGFAGGPA